MKFNKEDELTYLELVNKVAQIDTDAAVYMLTDMRELFGFEPSGSLWEVVVWNTTKQGTDYWFDIVEQIEG